MGFFVMHGILMGVFKKKYYSIFDKFHVINIFLQKLVNPGFLFCFKNYCIYVKEKRLDIKYVTNFYVIAHELMKVLPLICFTEPQRLSYVTLVLTMVFCTAEPIPSNLQGNTVH